MRRGDGEWSRAGQLDGLSGEKKEKDVESAEHDRCCGGLQWMGLHQCNLHQHDSTAGVTTPSIERLITLRPNRTDEAVS